MVFCIGKTFPTPPKHPGSLAYPLKDVADSLPHLRDDDQAALRQRMMEAAAALDAALREAREFKEPPDVAAPEQRPQ